MAVHGNPYDGHTLSDTMEQVSRIIGGPEKVFADQGYRGHNYEGEAEIHIDRRRRGSSLLCALGRGSAGV